MINAGLPVAEQWFHATAIDDQITLIQEPHVHPLLRANIWHIRGAGSDVLIDCGLGVAPLRPAFPDLFRRDPLLVLTHAHPDHMGSAHEFTCVAAHPLERVADPPASSLDKAKLAASLGLRPPPDARPPDTRPPDTRLPALMISALPHLGYDPAAYRLRPARVTRALADGDEISLGDRTLTVLHLPGHSPGSIALLDRGNGILFTGDVVYDDDELLDELDGSDIASYLQTMARLAALPADAVRVVHAGHDASFGRARLDQLTGGYLRARGGRASPASPASSASIASIRTGAGR